MKKFNLLLNKRTFTIIMAIAIMAASAVVFTVSAWLVSTGLGFGGGNVKIQAAVIDAKYARTYNETGIPGEERDVLVTVKIKSTSNRDFVYGISLPDVNSMLWDDGEKYKLGTVKGFTAKTDGTKIIDNKVYGKIGKTTNAITTVEFYMTVKYLGEEVIGEPHYYDGNVTQAHKFKLPDFNITYCQATPAAVQDVFGINLAAIEGGN